MYSPYYQNQVKTPQQLQQDIAQEMARYNQLYGMQNQIVAQQNGGRYIYVSSYDEVLNAPTSPDGQATLFVCFEKGLMWSKKFQQGQHFIQAFSFAPLNNFGEPQSQQTDNTNDFNARLTALENLIKGEKTNE